ncbi:hypothetical protein IAS59_000795 [Cryptococcus gattii]
MSLASSKPTFGRGCNGFWICDDARIGLLYDVACNFEAHLQRRGLLLSKIEQVDQVESATRHETLKRGISRKARELVGLGSRRGVAVFSSSA